ncbi:MAG: type II toxin-antitoxin system Phd/YefM family antitoxin [Clostridia bacterium]|nr:type II toxin-antitoxin system Phd/YefM family antitoxin [Clostridia bacterium]
MPKIIPIRDLRDTTKISEMCNTSNEPIFVTKNGYGDMVVMSISVYEQELARADMYAKIMEGKAQADNGELVEGKTALSELRMKYAK